MKTISLVKLDIVEFEVLREKLNDYVDYKNNAYRSHDFAKYVNNLLLIDIAQKMFYGFGEKIEKTTKGKGKMKLSISEAIILLDCCTTFGIYRNEFEKFTMEKIKNIIHQEIINL